MLSLLSIWGAKSSLETYETEDSNIVRTPNSPVFSCVFFREVRDVVVRIVDEHRVIVHRSDLVELVGLKTCVCIWLGQVAKLRDACAEWRVSCAFRTGKFGKDVDKNVMPKWMYKHNKDGWNMRREKARQRTKTLMRQTPFLQILEPCVYVTRTKMCEARNERAVRRKNVRATNECIYKRYRNNGTDPHE